MEEKEALVLVSSELKKYKLIRRNEIRGCIINSPNILVSVFTISLTAGTISVPVNELKWIFGIGALALFGAQIVYTKNEFDNCFDTALKIQILKSLKTELQKGINRLKDVNVSNFSEAIYDILTLERKPEN